MWLLVCNICLFLQLRNRTKTGQGSRRSIYLLKMYMRKLEILRVRVWKCIFVCFCVPVKSVIPNIQIAVSMYVCACVHVGDLTDAPDINASVLLFMCSSCCSGDWLGQKDIKGLSYLDILTAFTLSFVSLSHSLFTFPLPSLLHSSFSFSDSSLAYLLVFPPSPSFERLQKINR